MDNLAIGVLLLAVVVFLVVRQLRQSGHFGGTSHGTPGSARPDAAAGEPESAGLPEIYEIANQLAEPYNVVAHPEELKSDPIFGEGLTYLARPDVSEDSVIRFAAGENAVVSCMAIEALGLRNVSEKARAAILSGVGTFATFPQYFALNFLSSAIPADEQVIGRVLVATTQYMEDRLSRSSLEKFIEQRHALGEPLKFQDGQTSVLNDAGIGALRRYLDGIDPELGKPLLAGLGGPAITIDETDVLRSAGRIWDSQDAEKARLLIGHQALDEAVAEIKSSLTARQPQSVLLTGERGVGKTTIQRVLARQLFDEGWVVFVAGHADIVAGQVYIGQLEGRLKQVIDRLCSSDRIVWFIPNFDQLAFTGTHQYSAHSALDTILPYIEKGSLRVVAETQRSSYDRLLQRQPRISTAMSVITIDPISRPATLHIAEEWLAALVKDIDGKVIEDAWGLAQQYLSDRAAPGNIMDLLHSTVIALDASTKGQPITIATSDVIVTLAKQTGLPLEMLDPDRQLDLDDLSQALSALVVGQDEAVQCLVDRVAMMKAGLADPTRPVGVFLFAGPTGTGKTEIAKSLATWLFGSANRLIRIDMSELQTRQGLDRLLGHPDDLETASLADQVRKQPFSIVLLDEFEKAHSNVWDLFLQVFDDARMTDRRGRTTSFRHTIIILTANLGAKIPTGQSIGFGAGPKVFDAQEVHRAVEQAFRREFINRLDRVVVFRPLDRALMRQILHKELAAAFDRRGLKERSWAVEWDEPAISFLLEKGFTPDLGARPLKRAVERYLLAPLAATIVRHQVPEGDQFLFISCKGDALHVAFVDPEADDETDLAPTTPQPETETGVGADVKTILLQPTGSLQELADLRELLRTLESEITAESWRSKKHVLFAEMEQPDFWSSAKRFGVLGLIEYIDRVENGLERARSLLARLEKRVDNEQLPRRLVSMLAQNIYLLQAAFDDVAQNKPREAFLLVEARTNGLADAVHAVAFGHQIAGMYEAWADKRNMRITRLFRSDVNDETDMRAVYAVSGYGAASLLAAETGLHVRERPGETPQKHFRDTVRVIVAPQPEAPLPTARNAVIPVAEEALNKLHGPETGIVRRYREKPSPLVRDSVRGWRTGRIDLVLGGDFDLL